MTRRIPLQEESLAHEHDAERYGKGHQAFFKLMYRPCLRDVKAFNLSGRYLEIGAGPGMLAAMMAGTRPDIHITALDLSAPMADIGRKNIMENNLQDRVQYLVGDTTDEKFMAGLGQFDLVYSTYSLHHWQDVEKGVFNLWQAVKAGGLMYILDLKRAGWLYHLPFNGGFMSSIRASFQPHEVEELLKKTGMNRFRVRTEFPFVLTVTAWK
ncbi:MAG: class I SAM-dependent methyltransferase [Pseudomonadota bacterium]